MVKVYETENAFKQKTILDFCNKYEVEFPIAFIKYLEKYNDADLEMNVLDIGINECCIRYFYGTSSNEYTDICIVYEEYKGRLPEKCIPIADPDFGNQICMSLAKDTYGEIYFWDHETMDTDEGEDCVLTLEDMIKIADSFENLLDNIKDSPYIYEEKNQSGFVQMMHRIFKH